MSYTGSLAALKSLLTTAGAAMDPPIAIVRMAWPQSADRQICVEYGGDGVSPWGPDTFGYRMVGEQVAIKVYVPVAGDDLTAAEATELYLQVTKELIKAALAVDTDLGGACEGVVIGDAATHFEEWPTRGGPVIRFRTLTIPLTIGLADVSPIS